MCLNESSLLRRGGRMKKKEFIEARAKVTEYGGITRGVFPTALAPSLGAKAGDYIVFRKSADGVFTVHLKRTKAGTKKPVKAQKKS
jgi:hypothetical protein